MLQAFEGRQYSLGACGDDYSSNCVSLRGLCSHFRCVEGRIIFCHYHWQYCELVTCRLSDNTNHSVSDSLCSPPPHTYGNKLSIYDSSRQSSCQSALHSSWPRGAHCERVEHRGESITISVNHTCTYVQVFSYSVLLYIVIYEGT